LRLDLFRGEFPQVDTVHEKVVDLGPIITAGGVSSGIDLALHLLERYFGPEARRPEAVRLDGPWQ
jgi:transcriptional regulator GlxA family with amidase domain